VNIPIIRRSSKAQKQIEDPLYQAGYKSVRYMAYCFILLFVMFALDQLTIAINPSIEFSIFYYLGWIFTILAVLFGYWGLLLPQWFRNLFLKRVAMPAT